MANSDKRQTSTFILCKATINYYTKHIHQFFIIAAPLFDLQKSRFVWTAEHDRAFNTLRMRLTTAPILANFDPTKPTYVDCDASGLGLGAVPSQIVDNQRKIYSIRIKIS
jgi:RNase H-like domain found in reverse transcriptase